jgi:tetratricopeptide (TPR) repeat protein
MKRFGRLEFDDKKGPRSQQAPGEEVRDEQYFYDLAMRFWLAGDFEPALRNYSRALEKNNAFFPAWLGQVLMLIELGEYREAAVWSDKAMEMFPEHPELLAAKAVACARDGKIQKALAYSDNSVAQDNITSRVWLARAEVLANRQSRVAESCISKAVSIAGNKSPVVRLEAGRLLNKKGSYSAAMQYLQAAVDELPKSALAWYALGYCQAKLGRSSAKVTLQQCLELHPEWDLPKKALKYAGKSGLIGRLFRR